MKIKTFYIQ